MATFIFTKIPQHKINMHTQCLQCDSRSQWYFHCPLSLQITSESLINTPSRGGSLTAPALLLLPSPSTSLCHILIPVLPLWSCCLTSPNDSFKNLPLSLSLKLLAQCQTALCGSLCLHVSVKLCLLHFFT